MGIETKWTEGPWSLNEDASGDIFISSADGHYVAEIGAPEDDSALSDAHLIKTAPKLYHSLHNLLTHLKEISNKGTIPDRYLLESADVILAEARGEL